MALKEGKTLKGIRFRYHKSRKHGATKDKYWLIRHYVDGKQVEEGLGYSSEGWTQNKAIVISELFRENKKAGKRPQSMKDKRFLLWEQEQKDTETLQREKDENEPFDVFFERFLKDRETEKRPYQEIQKAEYQYKKYAKPIIGDMPPRRIKILNLKGIVRDMEKAGLAPRTIVGVIGLIGQVYSHNIVHHEYSYPNPVNRKAILPTRVKKHKNKRDRYLSKEEVDSLLALLPEPARTMSLISVHMGFRAGEIFKLKWSDINTEKISIRDTKNGQPRSLGMTIAVKEAISNMERGRNNEFVFINPKTKKPYKEAPAQFKKAVDTLHLNDDIEDRRQRVVFHTLRHTCASWLVRAGVDLYTVKEVLGHSSITVTERYVHESAKFAEAASVMDKIAEKSTAAEEAPIENIHN